MVKTTENHIKFTTLINSIGYSGYSVTKLKQGLEIFLRNGDKKKFNLCLEELYLFKYFSKTDNENKISNGILSSIVNKLILLFEEEISFVEVDKFLKVREYLSKFSEDKDYKYLKIVSNILFDSKLSKRNNYGKSYLKLDEDLPDEELFIKFKQLFEDDDEECLKYMYKILNNNNCGKKRFYNRKDNIYIIWDYLTKLENEDNIKKVLEFKLNNFFDKRNKNRYLFLASAVDLCLFKDDYVNKFDDLECKYLEKDNISNLKKKNREKLNLDRVYNLDESSKDEFYKIENEDEQYLREEWRESFLAEKKEEGIKELKNKRKALSKKEKDTIDNDSEESIDLKILSNDNSSDDEDLNNKLNNVHIL